MRGLTCDRGRGFPVVVVVVVVASGGGGWDNNGGGRGGRVVVVGRHGLTHWHLHGISIHLFLPQPLSLS